MCCAKKREEYQDMDYPNEVYLCVYNCVEHTQSGYAWVMRECMMNGPFTKGDAYQDPPITPASTQNLVTIWLTQQTHLHSVCVTFTVPLSESHESISNEYCAPLE